MVKRSCAGGRWCLGRLEGVGEQVAGRQAAVGAPSVGDGQDLMLGGEMAELVGGLDGLTEGQVTGKDDVLAAERDEHGALYRPRAYPRDGDELRDQFVVRQAAQGVLVEAAVGEPPG